MIRFGLPEIRRSLSAVHWFSPMMMFCRSMVVMLVVPSVVWLKAPLIVNVPASGQFKVVFGIVQFWLPFGAPLQFGSIVVGPANAAVGRTPVPNDVCRFVKALFTLAV